MDHFIINSSLPPEQLANLVHQTMAANGYTIEAGQPGSAVYETGSKLARALLGGLANRHKFRAQVLSAGTGSQLVINKDAKGYTGGAIGVRRTNKEFDRLHLLFNNQLQSQAP